MTDWTKQIGFEYKNKQRETPFETFLRYTDEKEKSAAVLGEILQNLCAGIHPTLADIGAGNGEYLQRALDRADLAGVNLTLVEPSPDLAKRLGARFADQSVQIVQQTLDDFTTDQTFDIVLASHLFYHVPRTSWLVQLSKTIGMLKPGGALIAVLREKDDVYDFKNTFKPLLFAADFKALTLDDVLTQLPPRANVQIARHVVNSELHIPYKQNPVDTVSIIEFYLNKPWAEIPAAIQQASLRFVAKKQGIFKQRDGIAVIQKLSTR